MTVDNLLSSLNDIVSSGRPAGRDGRVRGSGWIVWDPAGLDGTEVESLARDAGSGGLVVRVRVAKRGGGIVQQFAEPGKGPRSVLVQAWVCARRGEVILGCGDGEHTYEEARTNQIGTWELLRAKNGVSPANQVVIMAATPGADLLIGAVSGHDLDAVPEHRVPPPPEPRWVEPPAASGTDRARRSDARAAARADAESAPAERARPPSEPAELKDVDQLDDEPPTITAASVPARMLAGRPISNVSGTASPIVRTVNHIESAHVPTSVTVRLDNGQEFPTSHTVDWTSGVWYWSAPSLTFPFAGPHTLTAVATYAAGRGVTLTSEPLTVFVLDPLVVFTVTSPPTSAMVRHELTVQAHSPAGVVSVRWSRDADPANRSWNDMQQLTGNPGDTDRAATVTCDLPVQNGTPQADGAQMTVYLRAANTFMQISEGAAVITWRDQTAPKVTWENPQDGAALELLGASTEAHTTVLATVRDAGDGVVSGGVQSVQCTIDGAVGQYVVSLTNVTGTSHWSAPVTFAAASGVSLEGPHTLWLDCKDNVQLAASRQQREIVVRRSGIQGTTLTDYLADLVDFAHSRLLTGTGSSAAVTASHLEEALRQPFRKLAGSGANRVGEAAGQRPINAVRGAIEVLRAYLRPPPPAPVAHWPLDEGVGSVARDDTGGQASATLHSATWGPGRTTNSKAPVFDGTSSYVTVAEQAPPRDQLDPHSAVTVAAWINPSGPGGTPGGAQEGVIAGREASYLLARRQDGSLRWALATNTPGWGWIDTTASVPQNAWTHVAMSYDGSTMRIYVNGALQSTTRADGPIEPTKVTTKFNIDPGYVKFRIGSRTTSDSFFEGSIGDVAVFDRPMYGGDVKRLAGQQVPSDAVWLDDPPLPAGAQDQVPGSEGFQWTTNPTPFSGTYCHQSPLAAGVHQHYFLGATDPYHGVAEPWRVLPGDHLYAHVYLDPDHPPREVMLQWGGDGGWEHRAFWGDDLIGWGTAGQPSRARMGLLPPTGQWVRLEVPAALVGLENKLVGALAFTVYDGRAWWDKSGKSMTDPTAIIKDCGYLAAAYEAILIELGTSSEELRTARGAQTAVGQADPRAALAARLGMTLAPSRPDQLDQLLLSATASDPANLLNETNLERLFGLQPIESDPLFPSTATPLVQEWQEASLRAAWEAEDYGTEDPGDFSQPIVDPDVVVPADCTDPNDARARQALALRQQRASWLDARSAGLPRPSSGGGIPALLTNQLAVDLTELAAERFEGHDIASKLAAVPLDATAFERLITLSNLPDALTDDEWDEVRAIIVGALKRRQFAAETGWREQEKAVGLHLDPAIFHASVLMPGQLPRWRSSWSARVQWQQRLEHRARQHADVAAALAAAVRAGERVALPRLRDATLALAAPSPPDGPSWPTAADKLGRRLCTDLQLGPQLTTTRLSRAADALQVLLKGIAASGELASLGLPWALDTGAVSADPTPGGSGRSWLDRLQGELSWMGDYSSWLAAMSVFLYPENHLLPSLWNEMSRAFADLVATVTETAPPVSARAARDAAACYWDAPNWWPNAAKSAAPHPHQPPDELPAHGAGDRSRFPYTEQLSSQKLNDLKRGEASPAANREVYFFLPLLLALGLRDAGQWRAALDWLRIVYDRELPVSDRWVFDVSVIEGSQGVTRDENEWLGGGNLDPHYLASTRSGCYGRFTLMTIAGVLCDWADAEFTLDSEESRAQAGGLYTQALEVLAVAEASNMDPVPFIGNNPELTALIRRPRNGLAKLRTGLNIAGMSRPLADADGNPRGVPPATNHRYTNLVARAQQLANAAGQIEVSYLASLQQKDNETYQQLLAGQDLSVASAQVTIAFDQATVASEQAGGAQLQVQRAKTQSDTLAQWIAVGANSYERDQLTQFGEQQLWRGWAAHAQAAGALLQGVANAAGAAVESFGAASAFHVAAGVANAAAAEFSNAAEQAALTGQADALQASWERRSEEWSLQKQLADADIAIGNQQVLIAQSQEYVAQEQAAVARLSHSNALTRLQFLQTKFTNAQLYTWMAGVLGGVYRYFLQHAAGAARLAEQQLAFERQIPVPGYIKSDYWTPPTGGSDGPIGAGGMPATGGGGLAGSGRLLEDIAQLDQYAFDTERRKLQLTQTFSLAALAPVDLQRFRETGVLPFIIPASSYGAPGLYLATIRDVRISVAALIPPAQGIRGSLTSGGSSHIVVPDNDTFRTVTLARQPETIVLTSPANASGTFQVDLTPELMRPFEGCGLDLPFELQLPRAINAFDYRTVADVQLSIDYTALYSQDYAAQIIRQMPTRTSNSIALSLRDFPDAWYALLSQAQKLAASASPGSAPTILLAEWRLGADDLPANLSDPLLEQLTLMIARSGTTPERFTIDHLQKTGSAPPKPTSTKTVGDIVSTRNGSGAAWRQLTEPQVTPVGSWESGIVADSETIEAFTRGDVLDLVLVIGYGASRPAWPG